MTVSDLEQLGSSGTYVARTADTYGALFPTQGAGTNGWSLEALAAVSTFPAPTMRPSTANKPMAFDLMPNGSGYSGGNGYSWIDLGDADSFASAVATNYARLAVDDIAYVASITFNAGSIKQFGIKVPTDNAGAITTACTFKGATGGVAGADDYTLTVDPVNILAVHGGSIVAASGYRLKAAATLGFLYIPNINGTPSGAPIGYGQTTPLAFDQAASKLWARVAGAWKSVTFA